MHILLDNNILIQLLKTSDTYLLDKILELTARDEIRLLVPNTLKNEWNEKRPLTIDDLKKTYEKGAYYTHSTITESYNKAELQNIESRANKIDNLIAGGIAIPDNNKVKILISNRILKGLAPFHNGKTKPFNDAMIYFHAINYLNRKGFKELAFITSDTSDFGHPERKNEELHPGLAVQNIDIFYSSGLEVCLRKLNELGKIKYNRQSKESGVSYIIYASEQGKLTLLDYIEQTLSIARSKMLFIPPDIFCRIHPFRIKSDRYDYSYSNNYTLNTNNPEILEFFKNIDINKLRFSAKSIYKNTSANLSKLRAIIGILNGQYIFEINLIGGDSISIKHEISDTCNCDRCLYNKMEWRRFLDKKSNTTDLLKKAFTLFQLGLDKEALSNYFQYYQKQLEESNNIRVFQARYILSWMNNQIYDEQSELHKQLKEINSFDLDTEYFKFGNANDLDKAVAKFFHSGDVIEYFANKIGETTSKIKEHFQSQLRANYSSNNNLWNLISNFEIFQRFVEDNGLPLSRYSNFQDVSKNLVEGILLSHAINQYQPNRLNYFDDYILTLLFKYGNAEHIVNIFLTYIKTDLPTQLPKKTFEKLVNNFLDNGPSFIIDLEKNGFWQGSQIFYSKFWNLLILLSLCDFEKYFHIKIFNKILEFLKVLPNRQTHSLNHLESYIHARGKLLGIKRMGELFRICLDNPFLHNARVFESFQSLAIKQKWSFIQTEADLEKFKIIFLENCEKCQNEHKEIFYVSAGFINKKYQSKISTMVTKRLKENFNHRDFYMAAIYEVIDRKMFWTQYLSLFVKPNLSVKHPFSNLNGEISYSALNQLINLTFKFNDKLSKSFTDRLMGISDYYDWILDMHNFDYSKFNPLWVLQYPTRYFFEKIFSIPKATILIKEYLQNHYQPTLANIYVKYT